MKMNSYSTGWTPKEVLVTRHNAYLFLGGAFALSLIGAATYLTLVYSSLA